MKMNNVKAIWISAIAVVVGHILRNPLRFGFCQEKYTFGNEIGCLDEILPTIGVAIELFALPLLFFAIVTRFLREEVFRAWLHFAYWWIPPSMVLIWWAGGISGGGFGIPSILDQGFVAFALSALFALISLLIVLVKSLILHFRR